MREPVGCRRMVRFPKAAGSIQSTQNTVQMIARMLW
jgi:hypothetical protein